MGIVRTDERQRMEIEEFRQMLLSCAGLHRRKEEDNDMNAGHATTAAEENDDSQVKLVCVTSGVSFLGIAIVNQLLLRGYSVRVLVDNEGRLISLLDYVYLNHVLFSLSSFLISLFYDFLPFLSAESLAFARALPLRI